MNSGNFQSGAQGFDRSKAVDPMIGTVLDGRYEIVRLLGSGGMGAVYQANQVGLGKLVAIKIMHPQLMQDDRTVQRFRHEMKAMSSLSHPNLISITDSGTTDYGTPYFVMEYLPSRPLSDILEEEVYLSAERVKHIAVQIADALGHAHTKNVIHRDLKPANILVIESGAKDHVKIVDLGVAKLIGGDDAGAMMKLTQTGEVFGSPMYMAPEQVLGKPHDGRTDIYQLGCVLFEMVTGVPPLVKPSAIMTMNSHVTEPAPTFNQIMPELPMDDQLRQLEKIVLKCLEKEPSDRYQTMYQVLQAVEQQPVVEKPAVANRQPPPLESSQASAPIKDRFKSTAEREKGPRVVADQNDEEQDAMIRASSALSVSKARKQAVKMAGGRQNLIILGGVLFGLLILAMMYGIYSLVSAPHEEAAKGPKQTTSNVNDAKALYSYDFPAVAGDRFDVRVLSVYEGHVAEDKSADLTPNVVRKGTIEVDVEHESKPLILVLNAYMPTVWTIKKASSKVKIHQIVTVGYHYQEVRGVADSLVHPKVYYMYADKNGTIGTKPTHDNPFDQFYFLFLDGISVKDPDFQKMKTEIEKATKCHVRNFEGTRTTDKFTVR